jgi:hypothetical protein
MWNPPGPPSTPGGDPGILRNPDGYGSSAVAISVPNDGKYPDAAPIVPRGGQVTNDFGLYRNSGSLLTDFGQGMPNAPGNGKKTTDLNLPVNPQYSQDGPKPVTPLGGRNGGPQYTTDLYGAPKLFRRNDPTPLTTIAPQ